MLRAKIPKISHIHMFVVQIPCVFSGEIMSNPLVFVKPRDIHRLFHQSPGFCRANPHLALGSSRKFRSQTPPQCAFQQLWHPGVLPGAQELGRWPALKRRVFRKMGRSKMENGMMKWWVEYGFRWFNRDHIGIIIG